MKIQKTIIASALLLALPALLQADSFVNFESPHVSPLAMTPDGTKLLAINTGDNRVEVFSLTGSRPVSLGSVPVGLDPVSVRAHSNERAWVVNHISDTISIVDLTTMNVVKTIHTGDEPADVVFAGNPERAYVSISQENQVHVYDPLNLDAAPTVINIQGEDPRALAVSKDKKTVYAAIFESGNKSTILGVHQGASVVSSLNGPYGGQNPPPNEGSIFNPAINPELTIEPPQMGLIVKKNSSGIWSDGNNADWSSWISGNNASRTDRITGWDVVDNDIAIINTTTLGVTYYTGMMNIVTAVSVNPRSNQVMAIGMDATNEVRFVPNLKSRFLKVNIALGNSANLNAPTIVDLNTHLDYSDAQIAQQANPDTYDATLSSKSVGDPRGVVWNKNGTTGYVTGMGSNNVLVIDANGLRKRDPIEVGNGPTGLVMDAPRNKVYALNKFDGSITSINARNNTIATTVKFYDPTPTAIKVGRKHLYDTHKTSGLGQIACASCHVDGRQDRLAWDLGESNGTMTPFVERNCGYGTETERECHDFHPMKGPMLTQTLQDIIGHEPHHWRGDKMGLEDFNGAFTDLQGSQVQLTSTEMQEFEDFLANIYYPPNPYRNLDNTLPTSLSLAELGFESFGRFARDGGLSAGSLLPNGNAVAGLDLYRNRPSHMAGPGGSFQHDNACVMCHTLPTGLGADVTFVGDVAKFPEVGSGSYVFNTPGPLGEAKTMITGLLFGSGNQVNTFKVPQLRNLYDRRGFTLKTSPSLSGFGFFHDGSDTLDKFLSRFIGIVNDQEVADIIAFLMTFSGSDLPNGSLDNLLEPPGQPSKDAHAAVGYQLTFTAANKTQVELVDTLNQIIGFVDAGKVGLVAHGIQGGVQRGYAYTGSLTMQSDKAGESITVDALRLAANTGSEVTFTVVPAGSETRIGIDRDGDGLLNGNDNRTQ